MTEVSSQTLHVVSKELGTTLNEARVALENFAEHPETTKLLEQCAQQLHQAHGVLRMVEVYGAALLAEEMEQVTRYLAGATSADKNQAEGLDALMREVKRLGTPGSPEAPFLWACLVLLLALVAIGIVTWRRRRSPGPGEVEKIFFATSAANRRIREISEIDAFSRKVIR